MLAGDSRGAWDRHVLDDPRVVSLWDGSRLVGKWFADHSLGRQEEWEDSPAGYPQTKPYECWRRHDEYENV